MKSERGALVRGSDPPFGHVVHNMAGDMWRAPARRLTQKLGRWCVENRLHKFSISLRWQKIDLFPGLRGERRTPRATSCPLDYGPT